MGRNMTASKAEVAVIGTGITGIATAYYLAKTHGLRDIVLIDQGQPMAFTSAQSGENYRNWWPHPLMADFTNRSITLMEEIARATDNRIAMTRRGYVLCSRSADVQAMVDELTFSLGDQARAEIRLHDRADAPGYPRAEGADWQTAPQGFDVLQGQALIGACFPSLDPSVQSVLHIRRAGDLSGQQLGQVMLEALRDMGARRIRGMVTGLTAADGYRLDLTTPEGRASLQATRIVNAAGPFAGQIAAMLGVDLPLYNVMQQKIAFPDTLRAIPRNLPFAIDLDGQSIDWTAEERALLAADPDSAHLAGAMPGAIHCRPDGGDAGSWVKLGWAYNAAKAEATWDIPTDPRFPEIVLRGAARLHPALKAYYGRLPRQMHHYGGWYTRTADNWPLIGPMGPSGAFMACALSGHGTMAACATGELAAAWVAGQTPAQTYARPFSLDRYTDPRLGPGEASGSGLL